MKRLMCLVAPVVVLMLGAGGCAAEAAASRILAGPMPGWSGHRQVEIWVMVEQGARPVLSYRPASGGAEATAAPEVEEPGTLGTVLRYRPALLDPGTVYEGRLPGLDQPFRFQTQADWPYKTDPPSFTFIMGSCLYLNDAPYDRPGKPYGQGEGIITHMARSGADFMLWLGDNTYLRPADWTSPAGIRYRYERDKTDPILKDFWPAMHHFAIWDDHDFGPNDASKSYPLREVSTAEFRRHWANPPSGLPLEAGIMSTFVWSDCLFVLLDNRSNRDANSLDAGIHPGKTQLGAAQIEWLEQTLLEHESAPFKFIVLGGQFLKDHNYESFKNYPADRNRLLGFLERHQIGGVIFLSGDRHFTELRRVEREGAYPLYELTSSPLTSGIAVRAVQEEQNDPERVPGTLVDTQNFCKIEVSGPRLNRVLVMRSIDQEGRERWAHQLRASDLAVRRK
jgi:alkaline phosphatase D